jgi:hypothetical protein
VTWTSPKKSAESTKTPSDASPETQPGAQADTVLGNIFLGVRDYTDKPYLLQEIKKKEAVLLFREQQDVMMTFQIYDCLKPCTEEYYKDSQIQCIINARAEKSTKALEASKVAAMTTNACVLSN